MTELLAPVGNFERLNTALYFGADAVYLGGKAFGLRAFCDNFDDLELKRAIDFCHSLGRKVYVTLNIYAYDEDLGAISDYAKLLCEMGADAVIVSDPGIMECVKKSAPKLHIHLSTQANTTNSAAAKFWADVGVKRIVLAREVSLQNIRKIRDAIPDSVELEAFVHGAMCVAYSGRCLLSAVTTGRSGNRGECAQSCRWEYALMEKTREGEYFPIEEDGRGTYILNSKDMCMIEHIDKLMDAGVVSFKIEGRAKTAYYLATVVNAYRRAIDFFNSHPRGEKLPSEIVAEPYKTGHRSFNTGFYFGPAEQYLPSAKTEQTYEMSAVVVEADGNRVKIEQRNRFKTGDELEVMSPGKAHGTRFTVPEMRSESGEAVTDAKLVQQVLTLSMPIELRAGDILRRKISEK